MTLHCVQDIDQLEYTASIPSQVMKDSIGDDDKRKLQAFLDAKLDAKNARSAIYYACLKPTASAGTAFYYSLAKRRSSLNLP